MSSVNSAILFITLITLFGCIWQIIIAFRDADKKSDEHEELMEEWWQYFPDDEEDEIDDEKESNGSER